MGNHLKHIKYNSKIWAVCGYSCLLIVNMQKNCFFVLHTAKQLDRGNKTDDLKNENVEVKL